MKSAAPFNAPHRSDNAGWHMPQGVLRPLAVVGVIVGAVFGYVAAKAYAPGAELIAVCYTGLAMALATTGLWALFAQFPGAAGRYRVLRGALAAALAVPIAIFCGTVAVIFTLDPNTLYRNPMAIIELALFMVKFMVVQVGFISLPTAAIAGAATVRWRTFARPA